MTNSNAAALCRASGERVGIIQSLFLTPRALTVWASALLSGATTPEAWVSGTICLPSTK
jgi:hypothetical protein